MAAQFRVEPAGLSSAGGRLSACADALGAFDLSRPLARAAGAAPGSLPAGRAGALGGELAQALQELQAAVRQMSGSVRASAGNYTGADTAIAHGFGGFAGGGGSW